MKPIFCAVCKELIDPNEDYHLGPIDEFYHEECCPSCQEEDGAEFDELYLLFVDGFGAAESVESELVAA
jgi:hypothetical protein